MSNPLLSLSELYLNLEGIFTKDQKSNIRRFFLELYNTVSSSDHQKLSEIILKNQWIFLHYIFTDEEGDYDFALRIFRGCFDNPSSKLVFEEEWVKKYGETDYDKYIQSMRGSLFQLGGNSLYLSRVKIHNFEQTEKYLSEFQKKHQN